MNNVCYEKNIDIRGFTLIEIIIVVAIIAALAAIAIPGLLRARVSANDAVAQKTLKTMSDASEIYTIGHSGIFATDMTDLTTASPPYINENYCDTTQRGFMFSCTMSAAAYSFVATPSQVGTSGTTTYTIIEGGLLISN